MQQTNFFSSTPRRNFMKGAAISGLGMALGVQDKLFAAEEKGGAEKRVGVIGLDTSHVIAFTKSLNQSDKAAEFAGYKVVAAYPGGSPDFEPSASRVEKITADIKKMGVEIVSTIPELLEKVDVILLESVDGRPHLEQALPVMKAGKTLFIDKPVAGSLADAHAIFAAVEHYKVPVFSSSSLRYVENVQQAAQGEYGKVFGADTFGPCKYAPPLPDLYWYGIHTVEMLLTVMGTGCKTVMASHSENFDVAVGVWDDGRMGTFRGHREGKLSFGGTAFTEKKSDVVLGPYAGYEPLLAQVVKFFDADASPITAEDTLAVFGFMDAAMLSRKRNGAAVEVAEVQGEAQAAAKKKLESILS